MLALLALGVLKNAAAFPVNDLNEEIIASMDPLTDTSYPFYPELMEKMAEINRPDLLRALEQKVAGYFKTKKINERRQLLIEPIVEFDEKNLGGSLRWMKRLVLPRGIWKTP
jgi:hypothetical protein